MSGNVLSSKSSMKQILKDLGFKYRYIGLNNQRLLVERPHISPLLEVFTENEQLRDAHTPIMYTSDVGKHFT
jgi:hypothetical protein